MQEVQQGLGSVHGMHERFGKYWGGCMKVPHSMGHEGCARMAKKCSKNQKRCERLQYRSRV